MSITTKKDYSKYLKDSKTAPLSGALIAHGPPCSGKTRFAATASKFFPKTTGEKWVELSDIVYLTFDQGALDGLKVEKLKVPFIDARAIIADSNGVKGTMEALSVLEDYCSKTPVKYAIVDTLSEMSNFWELQFNKDEEQEDKPDPWRVLRKLNTTHTSFNTLMNKTCSKSNVVPFYLSHSQARPTTKDTTEAQKLVMLAERSAGSTGNDIGLDITGSGRRIYTNNASLIFACLCKVVGDKARYIVCPRGGGGFEGKDRLARILLKEEEPDLNAILAKVLKVDEEGEKQ